MRTTDFALFVVICLCGINVCMGVGYDGDCTDNSNCTDTGQICSNSSKCTCDTTNEYSYVGVKCVKELGRVCSTNAECNDNAIICGNSNNANVCKCNTTNYYDDNGIDVFGGTCIQKHSLGVPCKSPVSVPNEDQCTTENASCQAASSGTSYTCQCNINFIQVESSCVDAERNLGESCTDSSQCQAENSECTGGTCSCTSGYYQYNTGNTCLSGKIGDWCSDNSQCDANNADCLGDKCTCLSGYYTLGDACTKREYGESCTETSQCRVVDSVCTGTSGLTCTCMSGNYYYQNGNTCLSGKIGDWCSASSQCDANNAGCMGSACTCLTGYYTLGDTCTKRNYGESCTETSQCRVVDSVCTGTSGLTCTCMSGNYYHKNGNTCLSGKIGDWCSASSQCDANNAGCMGSACTCLTGYYTLGDTCTKRNYGESCTETSQCRVVDSVCTGTSGLTCTCMSGNYYHKNGNTCLSGKIGDWCSASSQCDANNAGCMGSACTCLTGYYTLGDTCTKRNYGESCTETSQCRVVDSVCTGTSGLTCTCMSGNYYYQNGNTCLSGKIGDWCSTSSQCDANNAGCTGSACTCLTGYYTLGDTCTKRDLGETCTQGNQCSDSNTICSNNCQCIAGFYDTNGNSIGGTCTAKVPLGSICPTPSNSVPATATCADSNAECLQDGSTYTCKCTSSYYDNMQSSNRKCDLKVLLGYSCPTGDACMSSKAECIGTASGTVCKCKSIYYDSNSEMSNGGECRNRVLLDNACSISSNLDQCSNANAYCTLNGSQYYCSCNIRYHKEGQNCVANKALGVSCQGNIVDECSDPHAECLGTNNKLCTCMMDYYRYNPAGTLTDTCEPVEQLKVNGITFSNIQTKGFTVSWSGPAGVLSTFISTYRIEWIPLYNSASVSLKNTTVTGTQYSVTTLKPGQAYTITVVSINSATQPDSIRSISSSKAQATKPEITTGIDFGKSDKDASGGIEVRWLPPTGTVSGYTVKLLDGTINISTMEPKSALATFSQNGLKNGYTYTISIQAKSERFEGSQTVMGEIYTNNFKTTPKKPNPPTSGACNTPTDRSIVLTWSAPSVPNGDLVQYHIHVYKYSSVLRIEGTKDVVTSYTIENLEPGTSYYFDIYTENEVGNSTLYELVSSNCRTKARMSDQPSNLQISDITSRGFTITWSAPNNTYSDENYGYILQIKDPQGSCVKQTFFKCSDCFGQYKGQETDDLCEKVSLSETIHKDKSDLSQQLSYKANLNPDILYTVRVAATNDKGMGHFAERTISTMEETPQTPTSVSAYDFRTNSLMVSWQIADPRPGQTNFTIKLNADTPAENKEYLVVGFNERSYKAEGLEEYWNYSVIVTATTSVGSMASQETQKYTTLPAAPEDVADFLIVGAPGGNYTQMKVTWKAPEVLKRNSVIISYVFKYTLGEDIIKDKSFKHSNEDSTTYEITVKVTPETTYEFEVYAVNEKNQTGRKTTLEREAPAGVPINIEETLNVDIIPKEKVSNVEKTQFSISLDVRFFEESTYGSIKATGLMACAKTDCNFDRITKLTDFNDMDNWKTASSNGYSLYRVTDSEWLNKLKSETTTTSRKKRSVEELDFTVGSDSCNNIGDTEYCNGPLQPETTYILVAVTCTNGGCLRSKEYGPFVTLAVPPKTNLAMIIGIVVGVTVALAVTAAVAFLVIKKKRRGPDRMKPAQKVKDEEFVPVDDNDNAKIKRKRPIRLSEIEECVANMHKDSNLLFSSEYEDLKTVSPKHSCAAADKEENRMRNRYINIIPFDHSRVKLSTNGEDDSSDYINANYLPGYTSPREYIGCQGPIPGTIDDFWRMVWEQNVSVVVMLTLCKEGQKIKCEQYWPDEVNEPKQYGDVIVEITSYSNIRTYDYRMFKITNGDQTRVVKHFHFLSWLDFQANVHHDIILDFIQHVRQHVQPPDTSGPMIIHCSAGVGRTGTYISLDHLIQFINDHDFDVEIDIFDMVLKLRENRMHMVQTEQQYVFIHDCVKEIMERKRRMTENIYENQGFSADENIYQNENLYANVSQSKPEQNTEL